MKRILTSTTALSLVLSPLGANPAFAQIVTENGSVIAVDGTVLCDASGGEVCDPSLYVEQAAAIEAQIRQNEEAAAEEQHLQDEAAAAEEQRLKDEAAAAEEQRLKDEAAAAEEQRLKDEAAAAEEQRLKDEAAAAEEQRLKDEAAAAEEQRLKDEAAAAEEQRLKDEADAAAEERRLQDEAAAAAEEQRLKDEAAAAEEQRMKDEAADALRLQDEPAAALVGEEKVLEPETAVKETTTASPSIENLPANMILTGDGSLLAQDNSILCDAAIVGACDPALYVEQANAISDQIMAQTKATQQDDAPQTGVVTITDPEQIGTDRLRQALVAERELLAELQAEGQFDLAKQAEHNIAFLEQELLAREAAAIQTGSAEDFPGRIEALSLLKDYRRALDEVNIEIKTAKRDNPSYVDYLLPYKANIETEIAELNQFIASRGAGDMPSPKVPAMPDATQAVADTGMTARSGGEALLAKIEAELVLATEAQDQGKIDALQERKSILEARLGVADAKPDATQTVDPATQPGDFQVPDEVKAMRARYISALGAVEADLATERAKDPSSDETRRLETLHPYLIAKIEEVDLFIATRGESGLTPFDASIGQVPEELVGEATGGTEGDVTTEILPPNLIRTGDGSLLAEDNTILCDTTVVEVCNAADYVTKADEITAFLDSQTDKGMDAEMTLPTAPMADPSAGLVSTKPEDLATLAPVAPIKVGGGEAIALNELLVTPTVGEVLTPTVAAGTALAEGGLLQGSAETPVPPMPLAEIPSPKDATVVIETLTDANTRNSSQEFAAAPVTLADGRRTGLTAFETVGLVALGALIVGAVINEGRKEERRVVSNTGDRVVVLKPDGTYQVYKDDDTVLRRPGSTVRTETFNDGSTRTIVQRVDGSQIVTIRDASGRVLRRAQYDKFGRERLLFDDFQPEEPVIITELPRPKKDRIVISSKDEDAALKARMAALEAKKAKRGFSLRQIREIPEVRDLAAQIDVESITFDSGSAAIKAAEAENLADLGQLMQELLEANPGEMFLIEGHTDATGHPAMNLALSDRRAESVALALAEYFDIPPENLVVQGYGESELLIDTQKDERANRRVLVRVITPLLKRAGG